MAFERPAYFLNIFSTIKLATLNPCHSKHIPAAASVVSIVSIVPFLCTMFRLISSSAFILLIYHLQKNKRYRTKVSFKYGNEIFLTSESGVTSAQEDCSQR